MDDETEWMEEDRCRRFMAWIIGGYRYEFNARSDADSKVSQMIEDSCVSDHQGIHDRLRLHGCCCVSCSVRESNCKRYGSKGSNHGDCNGG